MPRKAKRQSNGSKHSEVLQQRKGLTLHPAHDGGKDVFVQLTALERAGIRTLVEGQKVSFDTMQAVIPIMRQQGGGMILNVSSVVSKNYFTTIGGYASTKYALNALSLTARQELAKDNIVVSVFHPKMTATEVGQNSRGEKYSSSAGPPA